MKTAEQWVAEWLAKPADEHVLLVSEVLKIQADALRRAAQVADQITVISEEGLLIRDALNRESKRLSVRNDSQANKHC